MRRPPPSHVFGRIWSFDEESRGGICWAELFRSFWGPERLHPRRRPTVGVGAAPSRGVYTYKIIPRGGCRESDRFLRLLRGAFGAAGSDLHRTGPTVSFVPVHWVFFGPKAYNNTTRGVKRGSQAAGGRSVRGQQLLSVRGVQNSGGGAACIVKTRCLAGPPRECDSLSGWRDKRRFSLLRLFSVEEIF